MDDTRYDKEELKQEVVFSLTVGELLMMYKRLGVAIKSKERELLRMKHKGSAPHLMDFTRAARQRYVDLQAKIDKILADFDERVG